MHEGCAGSPRSGMDDEARGLVHDQQVLVLEGDAKVERVRDQLGRCLGLELHDRAFLEPVRLRPRHAVHDHVATHQQPFRGSARAYLLQSRQEAVEPKACRRSRNADADQEWRELSVRSSDPSSTATPTTIDASARLNAGHQRRSRKSVT